MPERALRQGISRTMFVHDRIRVAIIDQLVGVCQFKKDTENIYLKLDHYLGGQARVKQHGVPRSPPGRG